MFDLLPTVQWKPALNSPTPTKLIMPDLATLRASNESLHCTRRVVELAVPKMSKRVWLTNLDQGYVWGTQDPMWPVKASALNAVPSPRVEQLAAPKICGCHQDPLKGPQYTYSCGRSSQIWTVTSALHAVPSERILELALHKTAPPSFYSNHHSQFAYSTGRVSTIWEPSLSARGCASRPHTEMLAKPKQTDPKYIPPKPVQSVVTEAARFGKISAHVEEICKPKKRMDRLHRDSEWPVSITAREATASERTTELARAKRYTEGYKPSRNPIWKVGVGPKNAIASHRLAALAKPKIRKSMDLVQFNPAAFEVSQAALKAKATARIEELAKPN